jgi:tRNA nucleotidyltransferase (CCA-adding enzyme)
MHVILTHEQADFDAISAVLGAWLLNPEAMAVKPGRVNGNVASFLSLYSADLPFIEARQLPAHPIETITLVDTQSLVTLRGVNRNTRIIVYDHHQKRETVPDGWELHIDTTGSATTLFAEMLQQAHVQLNSLQATLLLLGIYEDTGCMTYVHTTARDLRAAAWLLEWGASLRLANEYMNPPLSSHQRDLYNRLVNNVQAFQVYGLNILVSQARGEKVREEISSVVHKMRDLLDPDALIILVSTLEGIRLVVRSTSDQFSAAHVAAHFSGGGHERAAAALVRLPSNASDEVRQLSLDETSREVIRLLPDVTRPPITVGQIMSPQPRLIKPDMPAHEALQLMQRYGYEGFPVVDDGKVLGLLTRRAIDRAIAHKLNLLAGSLMQAGEVVVSPGDTIQHLQQVMNATGWWQVPVLGATGEICGIVTRTDLLKSLSGEEHLPGRQNLASRLETALPPARLALLRAISAEAHQQHHGIYIVGGFVRDLLMDKPSSDFDIVVEGDAIALARSLANRLGGRLVIHNRFGTAKWHTGEISAALVEKLISAQPLNSTEIPETLDLISARTEFYDYPTALPKVETSSIKLDLHRRDFTINTLALRLDGNHYGDLYDYYGGMNDVRQALVRVLHSLSFIDDPTRMLRAIRFEQRFDFHIENRTLELMSEAGRLLKQVSGTRLRHELDMTLDEPDPDKVFSRLQELGLLSAIHPLLSWQTDQSTPVRVILSQPPDACWGLPARLGHIPIHRILGYLAWLGRLEVGAQQQIGIRLSFPMVLRDLLRGFFELWACCSQLNGSKPSQVVAILDGCSPVLLYAIARLCPDPLVAKAIERYRHEWHAIHPLTDGRALQKVGLKPGPHFGRLLDRLRAAWLDGEIHSAAEELQLLDVLISQMEVQ